MYAVAIEWPRTAPHTLAPPGFLESSSASVGKHASVSLRAYATLRMMRRRRLASNHHATAGVRLRDPHAGDHNRSKLMGRRSSFHDRSHLRAESRVRWPACPCSRCAPTLPEAIPRLDGAPCAARCGKCDAIHGHSIVGVGFFVHGSFLLSCTGSSERAREKVTTLAAGSCSAFDLTRCNIVAIVGFCSE